MTAKGKININGLRLDQTRILVTDDKFGGIASDQALAGNLPAGTPLYPASRKTRVLTATVTGAGTCGGGKRKRWVITTDRGPLGGSYPTIQTFWLADAPAPAADLPPAVTFGYQVSDNGGQTWRQVGTGFSAADIQAVRDRDPGSENTTWRAVVELDLDPDTTDASADIS